MDIEQINKKMSYYGVPSRNDWDMWDRTASKYAKQYNHNVEHTNEDEDFHSRTYYCTICRLNSKNKKFFEQCTPRLSPEPKPNGCVTMGEFMTNNTADSNCRCYDNTSGLVDDANTLYWYRKATGRNPLLGAVDLYKRRDEVERTAKNYKNLEKPEGNKKKNKQRGTVGFPDPFERNFIDPNNYSCAGPLDNKRGKCKWDKETIQDDLNSLHNVIESLQGELHSLEIDLVSCIRDKVLYNVKGVCFEKLQKVQTKITKKNNEINALRKELNTLRNELNTLRNGLDDEQNYCTVSGKITTKCDHSYEKRLYGGSHFLDTCKKCGHVNI